MSDRWIVVVDMGEDYQVIMLTYEDGYPAVFPSLAEAGKTIDAHHLARFRRIFLNIDTGESRVE